MNDSKNPRRVPHHTHRIGKVLAYLTRPKIIRRASIQQLIDRLLTAPVLCRLIATFQGILT